MRFLTIFFIVFIFSLSSTGQTKTIDSLLQNVYAWPGKKQKLQNVLALCEQNQSLHKDTLYQYAMIARQLAHEQADEESKSLAEVAVINAYLRLSNTDSALKIVEREIVKTPVTNKATRSIYFKLAALKVDCFGDASNYKDALSALYSIINEAEIYNDSLVLAKNMNTVGVINYNLDHLTEAFNWYFKGLSFTTSSPRFYAVAAALYINLAETYRWIDKVDSAEYCINKAIPLCEKSENLFYLSNAIRIRSSLFKDRKDFKQAEKLMQQCIAIREKTEGKLPFSNEQVSLASIYMHAGELDKAIKTLNDALAINTEPGSVLNSKKGAANDADLLKISYYTTLAKCYHLKGDNTNYLTTLEKIITAKDAFYEANSAHVLAELVTKYEVEKRENTIIQQTLNLTRKNNLFYFALAVMVFGIIVLALLFIGYRKREKLKMDLALQAEKDMSVKAVAHAEESERKRIATDLHDNLGAYAASIASNVDLINTEGKNNQATMAMEELHNNSQAIVSQLSDTIWALNKNELTLTAIADRIKIFIQRIQPSYPHTVLEVSETIEKDFSFQPTQAFYLFKLVQQLVMDLLKKEDNNNVTVHLTGENNWSINIAYNGKEMIAATTLLNKEMDAGSSAYPFSVKNLSSENGSRQIVIYPTQN